MPGSAVGHFQRRHRRMVSEASGEFSMDVRHGVQDAEPNHLRDADELK